MKKEKGFTLVELLAVIVILATILAISTPKIVEIIQNSQKRAFISDINELQGLVKLEYNNEKLANTYTFEDGKQTSEKKLEFKGNIPKKGEIKVYSNGDIEYALTSSNGLFCAKKTLEQNSANIEKYVSKCEKEKTIENISLTLSTTTTATSITVNVIPKDENGKDIVLTRYSYKISGSDEEINSTSAYYTFTKLKPNIMYTISVTGYTSRDTKVTGTTHATPTGEITFNSDPDLNIWSQEKEITIIYPELNNQNITNEVGIGTLQENISNFEKYIMPIKINENNIRVVARVYDGNNTLLSSNLTITKIDREAPTIESVTGNVTEWTNKDVTITINGAKDNGSGLSLSDDGPYSFDGGTTWQKDNFKVYESNRKVNILVKDNAGNIYTHNEIEISKIDKDVPDVPVATFKDLKKNEIISTKSTEDKPYPRWFNGSLWLGNFYANDVGGSRINRYEYSKNCTGTVSGILGNELKYTEYGQESVCIRAVDNAGNKSGWSNPYYIWIRPAEQTGQPIITYSPYSGYFNKAVDVTITASNVKNPKATSILNGSTKDYTFSSTTDSEGKLTSNIKLSPTNKLEKWKIQTTATNNTGSQITKESGTYIIDTENPVVSSYSKNNKYYKPNTDITVNLKDNYLIDDYQISVLNSDNSNYNHDAIIGNNVNKSSISKAVTLKESGKWTIYTYIKDKAGNVINGSEKLGSNGMVFDSKTYIIDNEKPTIKYSTLGGIHKVEKGKTKSIKVTLKDNYAIASYTIYVYKFNENSGTYIKDASKSKEVKSITNDSKEINETINLSEGKWRIYTRVLDKAGNNNAENNAYLGEQVPFYVQTYTMDGTAPELIIEQPSLGCGDYNRYNIVAISATDPNIATLSVRNYGPTSSTVSRTDIPLKKTVDSDYIRFDIALPGELGPWRIDIEATDKAGNIVRKTLNYNYVQKVESSITTTNSTFTCRKVENHIDVRRCALSYTNGVCVEGTSDGANCNCEYTGTCNSTSSTINTKYYYCWS